MGQLIVLRHGETEWSAGWRHTGRTGVPLPASGEAAAAAMAPVLARRRLRAVFSSPARRAVRTAELAGLTGIRLDPDLQEWDYGGYEGRTTVQIQAERPGWYLWGGGGGGGGAAPPRGGGRPPVQTQAERPGWYLWRDGVVPGDAAHPGESVAQVGARADAVLARVRPLLGEGGGAGGAA